MKERDGRGELWLLAIKYLQGDGVPKNYKVAKDYYEKSLRAGSIGSSVLSDFDSTHTVGSRGLSRNHAFRIFRDLGDIHMVGGYGVEKDYKTAEHYYKLAKVLRAEANVLFCLGTIHTDGGHGLQRDWVAAKDYFKKSLDVGGADEATTFAIFKYLGDIHMDGGYGVKKEHITAKYYYKHAKNLRTDTAVLLALGTIHMDGSDGVRKDWVAAKDYFEQVLNVGGVDASALFKLGTIHTDGGHGLQRDYATAKVYFIQALNVEGVDEATTSIIFRCLGIIHMDGGNRVRKDYKIAKDYFEKFLNVGVEDKATTAAVFKRLGKIHMDGGYRVEKNYEKAKYYLEQAAQKGSTQAAQMLKKLQATRNTTFVSSNASGSPSQTSEQTLKQALLETSGESLLKQAHVAYEQKNYKQAFKFYVKAKEAGSVEAPVCIGLMYYAGNGVQKNETRALAHFKHAANNGDKTAAMYVMMLENMQTYASTSAQAPSVAPISKDVFDQLLSRVEVIEKAGDSKALLVRSIAKNQEQINILQTKIRTVGIDRKINHLKAEQHILTNSKLGASYMSIQNRLSGMLSAAKLINESGGLIARNNDLQDNVVNGVTKAVKALVGPFAPLASITGAVALFALDQNKKNALKPLSKLASSSAVIDEIASGAAMKLVERYQDQINVLKDEKIAREFGIYMTETMKAFLMKDEIFKGDKAPALGDEIDKITRRLALCVGMDDSKIRRLRGKIFTVHITIPGFKDTALETIPAYKGGSFMFQSACTKTGIKVPKNAGGFDYYSNDDAKEGATSAEKYGYAVGTFVEVTNLGLTKDPQSLWNLGKRSKSGKGKQEAVESPRVTGIGFAIAKSTCSEVKRVGQGVQDAREQQELSRKQLAHSENERAKLAAAVEAQDQKIQDQGQELQQLKQQMQQLLMMQQTQPQNSPQPQQRRSATSSLEGRQFRNLSQQGQGGRAGMRQ